MSLQAPRARHAPSGAHSQRQQPPGTTPVLLAEPDRGGAAPLRPGAAARATLTDPATPSRAGPLRARTVQVRRTAARSEPLPAPAQRARLLAPWPITTPPSEDDRQKLQQRAGALEALYARASPEQTAELATGVPSLPSLAALQSAQQDCAFRLYAIERQALWSGAPRESLVQAYADAGQPLRARALDTTGRALEVRLREALMRALASLMTPGQRTAALDATLLRPWPGLGDATADASRDLLRRTFWSLCDLMRPEELAQTARKVADLRTAPTDAAQADRIMLLEHALTQSRARRAAHPSDDPGCARARLAAYYKSQPGLLEREFESACNPAPLLALEAGSLEPTLQWRALQIEVLTTIMSPEHRLLCLVHASRRYADAAAQRTGTGGQPEEHQVRRRLMQEQLLALFSAMTPDELRAAKNYLAKLHCGNAAASAAPSSPPLRVQKAHASFLRLCDEALQAITRPVRRH